jgi:hypothetical protein
MGGAMLLRHESHRLIVVIIKGGNPKHDEYSVDRGMADLKLQTHKGYLATDVCFQLTTKIWYG